MKPLVPLLLAALLAAGCQSPTREDTGTVIGGVLGGVLGAQVKSDSRDKRNLAIILGTLAGAYLGRAIGRDMDDNDRYRTNEALEYNRTAQPARWTNPDSGREWEVTPTRTYRAADGELCRDFTTTMEYRGDQERLEGRACREGNGQWRVAE